MRKIIDSFILFNKYISLLVKASFQYRLNAFLLSFAVFARESTGIIIVLLTLNKFKAINGWNLNELLFLFSILFLSYGVFICFFAGLRDFDKLVYTGEFDRYLLRPQGLLFQVIVAKSDYFASIGHGLLGIVLFLISASKIGVTWNIVNVCYYTVTMLGAVLIQVSIFLFFSCSSFYLIKTDNLRSFLFYNTRKFAGYPISIYPGIIQKILIYIVPFAFVNYFPAQFFLRKPDMVNYWDGYLYLTFLIGLVLCIAAFYLWKFSLKHYSSTGN